MKNIQNTLVLYLAALLCVAQPTLAPAEQPIQQTLITNANIFDGKSETLMMGMDVLVEANLLKQIGKGSKAADGATLIDGGGRTLMPGLTDAHVHLMLNDHAAISIYEEPWGYVGAQSVAGAEAMLLRGFTTVRDVGGPVGGLKKAIDQGLVKGPRILPSGPFISPLENIEIMTDPVKNFRIIMKDGVIYKNTLSN